MKKKLFAILTIPALILSVVFITPSKEIQAATFKKGEIVYSKHNKNKYAFSNGKFKIAKTTAYLTVKERPSTSAKTVGALNKNNYVRVMYTQGDWARVHKVKYNSAYGVWHDSYVGSNEFDYKQFFVKKKYLTTYGTRDVFTYSIGFNIENNSY